MAARRRDERGQPAQQREGLDFEGRGAVGERALEPQLDSARFLRCHRAHVVRLSQILAVEGDEVLLAGGRRVPLSRRCRTALVAGLERLAARVEASSGKDE